jgi:hypothetical protein
MPLRRVFAHTGLLMAVIAIPMATFGQSEGNNSVYNSSGGYAASTAYIDAGAFYDNGNSGSDICQIINNILTGTYPSSGAVVDARGVLPLNGNTSIPCSSNPFNNVSNGTAPTTILLPGTTILASKTWILPSNTRIIGEGSGTGSYTAIQATSGFTVSSPPLPPTLIQMGLSSTTPATGVVIEHLQLNGADEGYFDGIDNVSAGDGSYVNDVDILKIGPISSSGSISGTACTPNSGAITALCIGPSATYSGPYTNLNIAPSNMCGGYMCQNTACVKIQAQTRGLRNITCVGGSDSSNWPQAAIYLDAYATSIENVHVEAFFDAIVVGDYADGQGGLVNGTNTPIVGGNTIATVTGSYNSGGILTNGVHICNGHTSSGSACSGNSVRIRDLTITQVLSNGGSAGAAAIQDDINGWTGGVDPSGGGHFVGLYVIGNSNSGSTGGNARFTSAPAGSNLTGTTTLPSPTWGSGAPTGSLGGQSCASSGALFSAVNGTSNSNTIYVCTYYGSGVLTWNAIGS